VLTALLERPAEHDVVAAVDLVGLDAEALAGVTSRPLGGTCGRRGRGDSASARPATPGGATARRAPSRSPRLLSAGPPRRAREGRRGRRRRRTRSPRSRCSSTSPRRARRVMGSSRRRGRRARPAAARRRAGPEPAQRVTDDDEVAAVADRLDDGVRVLRPAGGGVLLRQVDGDGIVAVLAERRGDEVPVPRASAAAVDEREGGHGRHANASGVSDAGHEPGAVTSTRSRRSSCSSPVLSCSRSPRSRV
jgi:hypothetical protein